jgi:protein phosphatase
MTESSDRILIQSLMTFMSQGKRSSNEDYLLADQKKGVFVVADGFGGPVPGVEASKIACESVRNFLFREARDLDATLPFILRTYFSLAANVLFNALIHANIKVNQMNREKNVNERGGASVVAGFIDGKFLALANVGGCSAWLYRGDQKIPLVVPRTFGHLSDPFVKSQQEVSKVPLMALGMAEDLEPEIVEYQLKIGDWLILHTDGISNDVHIKLLTLKQKKISSDKVSEEINQLLTLALSEDNASFLLVII